MSRIYKTWEEIKKAIKLGQRVRVGYYSDGFLGFRSQLGSITEISDNHFIINNSYGFTCGVKALEVEIIDNSDITNKTWDNLQQGDILIGKYGDECEILGICGRAIFTSANNKFDIATDEVMTKEELIEQGYKIKAASEDKPSIDDVIKILDVMSRSSYSHQGYKEEARQAIEMLKKLK